MRNGQTRDIHTPSIQLIDVISVVGRFFGEIVSLSTARDPTTAMSDNYCWNMSDNQQLAGQIT
jgi:hypothetical protein